MANISDKKKKSMIQALEKANGIVSTAVKNVGINRSTHYDWYKNDQEYKDAVDDIQEGSIDFVEDALFQKISGGDTTAIIFYLKTKAKHRGYIEKSEMAIKHQAIDWKDAE